jgi:glycosyltransferase involved in cell wall biosynthesis
MSSVSRPTRVLLFVTSHRSTNGYSYVGYEIAKHIGSHPDIHLTLYGFQRFHNIPNHRQDFPTDVMEYDAFENENPKQAGFGIDQVKEFVLSNRPDVCVVYNDVMILKGVISQLKQAQLSHDFKIIAYVDQVYLCQKKEYVEFLNQTIDAAILFTPLWEKCIIDQGLTSPTYILRHGFNANAHFPIPKNLPRRLYGIHPNDFVVMNLNRNQPRKRWDICMQAMALLVSIAPNEPIKLLIGTDLNGAWNILEVYERELKKYGLTLEDGMKHVIALDFPQQLSDEDVNFLYNVADIGINTCDGEGFGLCNFQQAAIGIPQVVSGVGGFLDFFDDDRAVLVKPKMTYYVDNSRDSVGGEAELCDYHDFAAGILKYYNNRDLMKSHGEKCRKFIIDNYGWDEIVADLRRIVYTVLGKQMPEKSRETQVTEDPSNAKQSLNIELKPKLNRPDKKEKARRLLKERLSTSRNHYTFASK